MASYFQSGNIMTVENFSLEDIQEVESLPGHAPVTYLLQPGSISYDTFSYELVSGLIH